MTARASMPRGLAATFAALEGVTHDQISRFAPPPPDAKHAAVLVLLREGARGPETLLVTRGSGLRKHAGQVAFPGGSVEPDDEDAIAAALRETAEETTLPREHVEPVLTWPRLWIPVSGFAVTPVFAWCASDVDVTARDDNGEVVAVHRVSIEELRVPGQRRQVRYPNGAVGPGFVLGELFVWGFTGLLLDRLLHFAGWEMPWDHTSHIELPAAVPSPPDSLGPRPAEGR
ncbi:MAG: CoA pyrophosphatase [Actinobacteria bacterium]|nr:CoA pyrophosphatase [Actinomycetota bacterium]